MKVHRLKESAINGGGPWFGDATNKGTTGACLVWADAPSMEAWVESSGVAADWCRAFDVFEPASSLCLQYSGRSYESAKGVLLIHAKMGNKSIDGVAQGIAESLV